MRVSDISQGKVVFLMPLVLLGLAGVFVIQAGRDTVPLNGRKAATTAKPQLVEAYGRLPLAFESNQGQTDPQVRFLSRGTGYTLFLTATEATLTLRGGQKPEEKQIPRLAALARDDRSGTAQQGESAGDSGTVVRMKLVGANPNPAVSGLDELPGKSNYFLGNDPSKWRTNVPTYAKVRYEDVYPGIDLVYYGNQRQLEYDFVVSPGADPSVIQLSFEGQQKLTVDSAGDLVLGTGDSSDLRLYKPLVYQESGGGREEIAGGYTLQNDGAVGFTLAAYDASKPLIIDPVLIYSTYLACIIHERSPQGLL